MSHAEIFAVSSQFQMLQVVAALRSGAIGTAGAHRVLLVCNNAAVAENALHPIDSPVAQFAEQFFDRLIDFNELLYPLKPADFSPRSVDAPLLSQLLRSHCGIGLNYEVVLFLESVQSQPAKGLAQVFWDSELVVHADGLMVFGPSREALPREFSARISTLNYPELIDGITPLLLAEVGPRLAPTSRKSFTDTVSAFVVWAREHAPRSLEQIAVHQGDALVLGQYLGALNIVSYEQEAQLALDMVRTAAAHTTCRVVFKPHPSAARASTTLLARSASAEGINLVIDTCELPAEVTFAVQPPAAVVSAFSTALVTADFAYGIPSFAVGTQLLLEQLRPYQNSNRIPVTICDALFVTRPPIELGTLVAAVAYCMQSDLLPNARVHATQLVNGTQPIVGNETQPLWRRYIKKRRAEALGLIPTPLPDEAPAPRPPAAPPAPAGLGTRIRVHLHKLLAGAR